MYTNKEDWIDENTNVWLLWTQYTFLCADEYGILPPQLTKSKKKRIKGGVRAMLWDLYVSR
jgi:hypothetical protein